MIRGVALYTSTIHLSCDKLKDLNYMYHGGYKIYTISLDVNEKMYLIPENVNLCFFLQVCNNH